MKIDFTGVTGKQLSFEPVPAGKYVVEVTDYRQSQASENAKNPGAPLINWEFTIQSTIGGETEVEDKRKGETIKVEGRKIWDNMVVVEAMYDRIKAFLDACGFDTEGEIDFDPDEVIGSTLIVKVGVRGKQVNKETGEEYDPKNIARSFHPAES